MADSGRGMKLDSTMPKPEMLLTDVWLGTRKKEDRCRDDRHRHGQDSDFFYSFYIMWLLILHCCASEV